MSEGCGWSKGVCCYNKIVATMVEIIDAGLEQWHVGEGQGVWL